MNLKYTALTSSFVQPGTLTWIGIRPHTRMPVQILEKVKVLDTKLEGDHYSGTQVSKRHVTIIQEEHIDSIGSYLNKRINPEQIRRNLVVRGINLLSLKDKKFTIGEAIFEMTGICHPCSIMEENLGEGAYNAMRGHGGITTRIIKGGLIQIGDKVSVLL